MPSWRIEELDTAEAARPHRFVDPMELVLVVVAVLAAATLLPRALSPQSAATRVAPSYERAPTSAVAPLAKTLMLSARPLARGACGALTATSPAPTYAGVAHAVARIDASVTLALDPYWWWCVAGARFYDDGVEVVGRFIPIRDATGGPRPRVALRSTEIAGQLVGFGALGPGTFGSVGAYDVLRLRAVSDNGRRDAYPLAISSASAITLQLSSMGGDWGFLRAPAIAQDPAVVVAGRGADGAVRAIYLGALGEFSVRLPLAP